MRRIEAIYLLALTLMVFLSPFPAEAKPDEQSRNILIDHFENASPKNLLGGFIGSDTASPGTCAFSFTMAQQDTFGRAYHALRMDYDVRERGSYTYLWLHLGPEGQDGKIQTVDLNGHSYLSFWAKSGKRGVNVKIELHCDTNGTGRYEPGEDASAQVYADRYLGREGLKDSWRKIVIPLADFAAIKDRSRALEIVFVFENLRGNTQGTLIVDEILFGLQKLPDSRNALIMPTPVTLVPATATVQAQPQLKAGFTHALAARRSPSEYLEGVGFEVSWDEGKSWSLVGIDYEARETGNVSWTIPPLPPSEKALVRAFSQGIYGHRAYDANPVTLAVKPFSDDALLREIARRSFLYFRDFQDPVTGLFLDAPGADASTAVTGFGLAALAIGAQEEWMKAGEARSRVEKTLTTYLQLQNAASLGRDDRGKVLPASQDGFFYHFMKAGTAKRAGRSEISVVDTAILLMGALTAGEYFGGEIKAMASKLYRGVKWEKFYDAEARAFRMAWSPEEGYFPNHWDYFTDEALLIQLLAAGSRKGETGSEAYQNLHKEKGRWRDGEDFIVSWTGSLFTYQYLGVWLDLAGKSDAAGNDWWENSRRAIRSNRDFCWYNQDRPESYGPHRWGISCLHRPVGYTGNFGALPNGSGEAQEDGTLSPIAGAASLTFLPFESVADMKHQLAASPYLLGPYGLRNSYNLKKRWFSNVDFGMDTGLLLLAFENVKNGFVWRQLGKNGFVREGLRRCGIKPSPAKRAMAKLPLLLPKAPVEAPAGLIQAQDIAQEMENLALRGDLTAFREFNACADERYAAALELLDSAGIQASSKTRLHTEWLRALIAYRQASGARMRRHFGKMLQCAQEWKETAVSGDGSFLASYLYYAVGTDLRDFQEPLTSAFLKTLGTGEPAAKALEDLARQCQLRGRYAMAVKAWMQALDLRRSGDAAAAPDDYTRKIAEGFLDLNRAEDALLFDRMFLKSLRDAQNAGATPQILDLARQYQEAGVDHFSKECYAALLSLPQAQSDKNEVLYQLARLEQAHKNHNKAIEHFKALLEQPEGPWTQYAKLGVAVNNLFLRNDRESVEDLERFIRDNPDSALRDDAALSLGMVYFQSRKYELARKHLESISSQNKELQEEADGLKLKIKLIK